jgi:ankyrin repeat protein
MSLSQLEGLRPELATSRLDTDLIFAAEDGNAIAVAELIQKGANIHADNNDAMIMALAEDDVPVVRVLINAGFDRTEALEMSIRMEAERVREFLSLVS